MASIKQFSDPLTRKKSQPVPTVQRKLKVGNPNDKSEQEANNVADRVMRMPENEDQETLNMQPQEEEEKVSKISRQAEEEDSSTIKMQPEEEEKSAVSMKPEEEEASLQKQEDEEKVNLQSEEEETSISKAPEDKEEVNLKSTTASAEVNYAPSTVVNQINASKSGGQALPKKANAELSQKMGRDFSDVKIHKDSRAVQMNKDLSAKAFTHKNHIYFNQGKYNPESSNGKHLLAHELTHVAQQKGRKETSVSLKELIQKQDDASAQTITSKALTSHNGKGWLLVKLENNEIVSLAINTRVEYLGYNNDKSRELFKILDWPYEGKKASVKAISDSESRFSNVSYGSGGKVVFEIGKKRLKYGSSSWIGAYTSEGNEVPTGTHKLWLPDYPHAGGNNYTGDSAQATIWFRIGGENSSRYLHIGRYTAGCVTVGAIESGDESARSQWTNICNYLLTRRSGNDSVGEIEVKS